MSTDERELNERLAEWAGFRRDDIGWWLPPVERHRRLPPFTESLDAQVAHLWPKLAELDRNIQFVWNGQEWSCFLNELDGESDAITPALACAKAIDQAIREAKP